MTRLHCRRIIAYSDSDTRDMSRVFLRAAMSHALPDCQTDTESLLSNGCPTDWEHTANAGEPPEKADAGCGNAGEPPEKADAGCGNAGVPPEKADAGCGKAGEPERRMPTAGMGRSEEADMGSRNPGDTRYGYVRVVKFH